MLNLVAGIKNKNVTFGFNFNFDYDSSDFLKTKLDDEFKDAEDKYYKKSKILMKNTLNLMKSKDSENEILSLM